MSSVNQQQLDEQMAYYRARASEYDEWFMRLGRYDHGEEQSRQWFAEVAQVQQALATFAPRGRILEFACGTGWWTEQLEPYAEGVVAVDASPEVIKLNQQRVDSHKVTYVVDDIFAWMSPGKLPAQWHEHFDVVFFSFWLSHVPPEFLVPFWNLVKACLKSQGRVFFIDSLYNHATTANNQPLGEPQDTTMLRRLNDGRTFEIFKIFYEQDQLENDLSDMGWRADVMATDNFFLFGKAER